MAATMTALEACPFCGNDKSRQMNGDDDITLCGIAPLWFVSCPQCGATGPSDREQTPALKAWNTRALSAREEQVRRTALVEGARWALKEARPFGGTGIDAIDPAAILEREKVKP